MKITNPKIIGFLQNAWSPMYAGGTWPRESWLKALWRSRSGQRLRILTTITDYDWWFDNTTPIVGETPDSVVPPDAAHIENVLTAQKPDVVVTFGKQAAGSLKTPCLTRGLSLLILPHPAHRIVTNQLYEKAGLLLKRGFRGQVQIKQEKGYVSVLGS